MASALIHIAVAKVLENKLNIKNKKDYYLGSIAPDISKQIGETKEKSHFIYNEKEDIPNLELFTNKYKKFYNNDFELGYYIHLYTDKLWYGNFQNELICGNSIKLLDGTILNEPTGEFCKYVYQDYTNLNIQLIDQYNLDLSLFYEKFEIPKTSFNDIPLEKLNILIDKIGIIIENSTQDKCYIFDMYLVNKFIKETSISLYNELKKYRN